MARTFSSLPVRIATWAGLACVLWCALGGTSWGQPLESARPPRVRMLFNTAREMFKRGDYENAAVFYAQAKASQNELTATERQDLAAQIAQNNTALQGRRDGAAQVRQAEDALNKGRLSEATSLIKGLETNQFLAGEDKQTAANLTKQLRTTVNTQAAKNDYKSLLVAARSAFNQGDYELAETLANQADKMGTTVPAWMHPWSDSPAKVRREAQAARAKTTTGPNLVPANPDKKDNPFQTIMNFTKPDSKLPPPPVFPEGDMVAGTQTSKYAPLPAIDNPRDTPVIMPKPPEIKPVAFAVPDPKPAAPPTADNNKSVANSNARQLIKDGYKALEVGDIASAQRLAMQAKQQRADFDWREENPDRLLAEITRRQQAKTQAPAQKSIAPEEARGLVRQGRALLQQEKIDEADKCCTRAAGCTTARWGLFEDSPDKLRVDVAKARSRFNREESVRLMADARKLYGQGSMADAKAKAVRAQLLHGPYTVFELGDRPESLLKEIHRAELTNKGSSPPPPPPDLAELIKKNGPPPPPADVAEMMKKHGAPFAPPPDVAELIKKHGLPFPPPGDYQAAQGQPKNGLPELPPNLTNPPANNALASEAPQTTKQTWAANQAAKPRAVALLREARELESRWFLSEARAKAQEAALLKAPFAPDEDSPEHCLLSLQSKCDLRVKQLVLQASNQAFNTPTDPNRFKKALADLGAAKKLGQSFGLDTFRIDQEAMRMQQAAVASGVSPVGGDWPGDNPQITVNSPEALKNQQVGLEKLALARQEINHGNYGLARKFAEEATHPDCGIQQQALAVIRSIDAEETSQRMLTAKRNADAGFDAFRRGSYQQAASIFNALDLRLLPPEVTRRIGDLMSSREMQSPASGNLVQVKNNGSADGVGKTSVGDLPPGGADLTEQFSALEKIQVQQLMQRGLTAERTAIQRMNAGDTRGAIDVLKDYLEALNQAQIEPGQKETLRRRADNRLQQYKSIQAQRMVESNQVVLGHLGHNEPARNLAIQKTQQDVVELMKTYNQLAKEGKYTEALAQMKRAKEIDPDNVAVQANIRITETLINQKTWDDDRDNNGRMLLEATRQNIYPEGFDLNRGISFNEKVLEQARKRGKDGGVFSGLRSPSEREIESKLLKSISLSYKDAPLQTVLDDLQKFSGINIVTDRQALTQESISLDQPLNISLEKVSTKSALNLVLKQVNLTWVIENEVLLVTTPNQSKGRLVQKVYSVADLVIPVPDYPLDPMNNLTERLRAQVMSLQGGMQGPTAAYSPTGLGAGQPVSSSSSGTYSGGLGAAMSHGSSTGGGNAQATRANPTNTIEQDLINLITNAVQQNTWSQMGGPGNIQYFPLGHALIVNQTQEVQEDVLNLLQSLRRLQDLEVAIEVKLVQVADSFFERIGVDFDLNILTPKQKTYETQLLSGQFQPPGFINRFRPDNFVSGLTPAGTFTSDLSVPIKGTSFDFSLPPFGNLPGTLGSQGGISLGLAFLSDIQVYMFMEAAQGNRRLNVMQAPKLTVFNGQTANITVTDQIFFLTNAIPTYFGNTLAFVPQNQPFPIGMTLQVNPVVSADRRFVRMNLQPSITGISGAAVPLIPFQTVVPTQFDGGGTGPNVYFQMFFQQPQFSRIELNTTVNVPDGGTVLLGGLKVVAEGRSEYGAPLLGKIPYLDRLFRNVGYGREAQNLMIMVTPRIIINEEEEQIFLGIIPPIPRP